jgi:archaeosine synthase
MCPACDGRAPAALDEEGLRGHNQWTARTEMARVRNAIRGGRLRLLVESRVRTDPEAVALLRRLDAHTAFFEQRAPVASDAVVLATTQDSLRRPEVVRFRNRVVERYTPPPSARFLLLLPCSARKPYGTSKSHRRFHDAMWRSGATSATEEWIVTSPLGVVPRALERTYPAAHYDVPVTGQWDAVEGEMIRGMVDAMLRKRSWDAVVVHLPPSTLELVRPVLPADAIVTCPDGGPSRGDNLDRLTRTMQGLVEGGERPPLSQLLRDRMLGVASYQFGPQQAQRLLGDATVRGKWPGGKFIAEGVQLASMPINKGLLSMTLDGGRRMLDAGVNLVEIDDFDVKGSVFAVGVRGADDAIRVGDEVVLHHAGRIKGVGVAAMAGPEMVQLERGEAVKVRHHA